MRSASTTTKRPLWHVPNGSTGRETTSTGGLNKKSQSSLAGSHDGHPARLIESESTATQPTKSAVLKVIAEEKLMAIDKLRREPVTKRIFKLLAALFIDRVLLGAIAMAASAILLSKLHGWWKLVGPLGTLIAFAVANQLLNRMRLESSSATLREAPLAIQRLVRAPFIVFGHSHAPERIALDGGGTYFNTGTWASDDLKSAFTHLLVTSASAEGEAHAELRQWVNGSSVIFPAVG